MLTLWSVRKGNEFLKEKTCNRRVEIYCTFSEAIIVQYHDLLVQIVRCEIVDQISHVNGLADGIQYGHNFGLCTQTEIGPYFCGNRSYFCSVILRDY